MLSRFVSTIFSRLESARKGDQTGGKGGGEREREVGEAFCLSVRSHTTSLPRWQVDHEPRSHGAQHVLGWCYQARMRRNARGSERVTPTRSVSPTPACANAYLALALVLAGEAYGHTMIRAQSWLFWSAGGAPPLAPHLLMRLLSQSGVGSARIGWGRRRSSSEPAIEVGECSAAKHGVGPLAVPMDTPR